MRLISSALSFFSDQMWMPKSSRPRGAKCNAASLMKQLILGDLALMATMSPMTPAASPITVTLPLVFSFIHVLRAMASIRASHSAWKSGLPITPLTNFSWLGVHLN